MQFSECITKFKDLISLSTDDVSVILLSIAVPFIFYFEEKFRNETDDAIIFISSYLNYEKFYERDNFFRWYHLSKKEQIKFFENLEIIDNQPFLKVRSGEENTLIRKRQTEIKRSFRILKFLNIVKYSVSVAVIIILTFTK